MFNFEKLDVWQKAIEFAELIYTDTRSFPTEERFGLTTQLRRAAVSISSNIAEESSRSSKVDFARFIEIAGGSVFEVVSECSVARRQNFLNYELSVESLAAAERESPRQTCGLRSARHFAEYLLSRNARHSKRQFARTRRGANRIRFRLPRRHLRHLFAHHQRRSTRARSSRCGL